VNDVLRCENDSIFNALFVLTGRKLTGHLAQNMNYIVYKFTCKIIEMFSSIFDLFCMTTTRETE
jgi:hypothetical protein